MKTETKRSSIWKTLLWFIFPPYGLFVLFFRSRLKWFFKVPVGILIALVFVLAVDQASNPYRVEDKLSKETIMDYIARHPDENFGNFRKSERAGQFKYKGKMFVVYRTLTEKGLYDFVIQPKMDENYKVDSIMQTYPSQVWKLESKEPYPVYPMAMVYMNENQEKLGEIQSADSSGEHWTFKSDKGTFRYTFEKNKVTSIMKKDGAAVLNQPNEYDVPEDVPAYFKERKDELGTIEKVYEYEMDTKKESYYIRTKKGQFRVDCFDDGTIELLQAQFSN